MPTDVIKESWIIEVQARTGEWVEVERVDLPEGCNWTGAVSLVDLVRPRLRSRFERPETK